MSDNFITIIVCSIVVSIFLNIMCFQSISFLKEDIKDLQKELWQLKFKE